MDNNGKRTSIEPYYTANTILTFEEKKALTTFQVENDDEKMMRERKKRRYFHAMHIKSIDIEW